MVYSPERPNAVILATVAEDQVSIQPLPVTQLSDTPCFSNGHALHLCSTAVQGDEYLSHWSWQIFSSILRTLVNTAILQGNMHMASADIILTDPELAELLGSKHTVESTIPR